MKPWLCLLLVFKFAMADPTPIVLWHGMGNVNSAQYYNYVHTNLNLRSFEYFM